MREGARIRAALLIEVAEVFERRTEAFEVAEGLLDRKGAAVLDQRALVVRALEVHTPDQIERARQAPAIADLLLNARGFAELLGSLVVLRPPPTRQPGLHLHGRLGRAVQAPDRGRQRFLLLGAAAAGISLVRPRGPDDRQGAREERHVADLPRPPRPLRERAGESGRRRRIPPAPPPRQPERRSRSPRPRASGPEPGPPRTNRKARQAEEAGRASHWIFFR